MYRKINSLKRTKTGNTKKRLKWIYSFALLTVMMITLVVNTGGEVYAKSGKYDKLMLSPGGVTFGVQMKTDGVLVVGFAEIETEKGKVCPAHEAKIEIKDIIYAVNGSKIDSSSDITRAFEESKGQNVTLSVRRGEANKTFGVCPVRDKNDGSYRAGLFLRDSTAGIGTVTFIDPKNMTFAGLGHGICDADTGVLMPMRTACVCPVTVNSVRRGKSGAPGEIRGFFGARVIGSLTLNTSCGVCGTLDNLSEADKAIWLSRKPMPVANENEIEEGNAFIYCTVNSEGVGQYSVKISDIEKKKNTKNFSVELTDPKLLKITGGIVQGMSGSPIIQNGKIIGAVTHVTVNDPTKGYGISIENMLDSMYAHSLSVQ